jgi:surfeit locus 1 family protein
MFRPTVYPSIATVVMLAVLCTLGTWQLGRAKEKAARIDAAQQLAASAPLRLDNTEPTGDPSLVEFMPVSASGTYDSDHQFLLDNRTHAGRAGFHVLTPLRLPNNTNVLVNRGWVPVGARREDLPAIAIDALHQSVRGNLALAREDQLVLGQTGHDDGAHWPWVIQRVEFTPMQSALQYPLLPVIVQLDSVAPYGFVRQWSPVIGIGPERHQGYALQWFSLALALVTIYIVVNAHRINSENGPPHTP